MARTAEADAREFLEGIYGRLPKGKWGYLWTLPTKRTTWFDATRVEEAVAVAAQACERNEDVYCGVGFAAQAGTATQRVVSRARDAGVLVAGIVGFVADIDFRSASKSRGVPDEAAARTLLGAVGYPPTCLVGSGGGLHAWWAFREPAEFESDAERTNAVELAAGWSSFMRRTAQTRGWDIDPVGDLSRVLRVPGTTNFKERDNPRPVVLLEADWSRRYNLSDYETWRVATALPLDTEPAKAGGIAEMDVARHEAMLDNLPEYKAVWNHTAKHLAGKSASEWDMALASHCAHAGHSREEIVATLHAYRLKHAKSPDDFEKAGRVDYLVGTADKALASAREHFAQRDADAAAEDTVADEEAPRDARIAAVGHKLGFPLTDVQFTAGPPSFLRLWVDGACVDIPARRIVDQHFVRGHVAELTRRVIRKQEGAAWDRISNTLLEVAEVIEGDPEATQDGELLSLIGAFATQRALREYPPGVPIENPNAPFIRSGVLWFKTEQLRAYMRSIDLHTPRPELLQRMRTMGVRSDVVCVRQGSKTAAARFRGLPYDMLEKGTSETPSRHLHIVSGALDAEPDEEENSPVKEGNGA